MASAVLAILLALAAPAVALEIEVAAPRSLSAFAARIRALDQEPTVRALADAGLEPPVRVRVTLMDAADPRAVQTPDWIVGLAFGAEEIVIFPTRIGSYPYDSLESVLRHELVHLALNQRASGARLPRWFHEGVAVSVERGWGFTGDLRLLLAALSRPGLDDLGRVFATDSQLGNATAYLLATALVDDLRARHGAGIPGAIAARAGTGVPFATAFEIETGETPEAAAAIAWATYRRWNNWLPMLTGGNAIWTGILFLALLAFIVQRRRRAQRRRRWDEEDGWPPGAARQITRALLPPSSATIRHDTLKWDCSGSR